MNDSGNGSFADVNEDGVVSALIGGEGANESGGLAGR